jgi:tetratricopeptide (TPR) repeat protein
MGCARPACQGSRQRLLWIAAGGLIIGLAMSGGLSAKMRLRAGGHAQVPAGAHYAVAQEPSPEIAAIIADGQQFLAGKQYESALRAFQEAQAVAPRDPWPIYNIGRVHSDLHRAYAAERCYREALALDPDFVPALADLATTIGAMGRSREALSLLERAQAAKPDNVSIRMMLGQNLLREGQSERAIEALEGALRLPGAAGKADLFVLLGQAHFGAGHDECARQALEKALQIDPRMARAHLRLNQLLLKTGHPQEAQQEAVAFTQYRQLEERILNLTQAVAAQPDDVELLLALARANLDRGRPDTAARVLSRAMSLAPQDPAVRELAVQVQAALGPAPPWPRASGSFSADRTTTATPR